jgi:hypothetical protein
MSFKQNRRAQSAEVEERAASRKELARQARQQAYQKAKQQRATDPKHIAMKEAARQQRRDQYQKAKAQRKAAAASQKVKQKIERTVTRTVERAAADQELTKLVTWATTKKTPYDIN